jgi:hypothetical protein
LRLDTKNAESRNFFSFARPWGFQQDGYLTVRFAVIREFSSKQLSVGPIEELWRRIGVKDPLIQQWLINTLSIACSRAAVLLRASDASSLARADDYPHKEWRDRFLKVADNLASMGGESMDKTSILGRLVILPLDEMIKLHLVAENALKDEAVNYTLPRSQKKDFDWPLEIPLRDAPVETP